MPAQIEISHNLIGLNDEGPGRVISILIEVRGAGGRPCRRQLQLKAAYFDVTTVSHTGEDEIILKSDSIFIKWF